jgi:hypothetical protein
MSSSTYKCMVVIPEAEYTRLTKGKGETEGMVNTVGEGGRDNAVTNVRNEGGVVLVNTPAGQATSDKKEREGGDESGEGGKKGEKKSPKSKKELSKKDDSPMGDSSGKTQQAGRFARLRVKAAAVSKSSPKNKEEREERKNVVTSSDAGEKKEEGKPIEYNEFGRPILKGKRVIHTLKRKRGDFAVEGEVDRKRQREEYVQHLIDEKLAKLQGRMPPSPFTSGSLTTRPIARVLQAPIFKPQPLEPMDVDEDGGVRIASAETRRQLGDFDKPSPMDEDLQEEPVLVADEERVDAAQQTEVEEETEEAPSLPLVPYRRGKKRVVSANIVDKPPEKRRWLGERSHTDANVSYPDDEVDDELASKAIDYEAKPSLTYVRRGRKRVPFDGGDPDEGEDKRRREHDRRGQKRLTYEGPDRAFKRSNMRGQKRQVLLSLTRDEPKRPNLSSRKRAREDDEVGNERKKLRRKAEKRSFPYEDDQEPPLSRGRYEDDNEYELW